MVDVINALAFLAFLILFAVGTGATLSRVVAYRIHGIKMPRLLIRDAQVIGGFAFSFGLILAVRVLRAFGVDVSGLATNIWWTVGSSIPALWAVAVYAFYEVVVIERGTTDTYADRENPAGDS